MSEDEVGAAAPAGVKPLLSLPARFQQKAQKEADRWQWGTEYSRAQDLGTVAMKSDSVAPPVEKFTIAIESSDSRHGTLVMAWGRFGGRPPSSCSKSKLAAWSSHEAT